MDERVKVVIVGAGPAGAAAGIFLKRAGIEPLLIEEREPGGLLREANLVENYPGFPNGIVGRDLADLIGRQLSRLDVRTVRTSAKMVSSDGGSYFVDTDEGTVASDAVVIATGTAPRRAVFEGAAELEGERLFYGVSVLHPDDLRGKSVIILGGGDAAFDYAINLSDNGASVTILSRSDPSCLPLLAERARDRDVKLMVGCEVARLERTGEGVSVSYDGGRGELDMTADMVIVAHGRDPRLELLDPALRRRADTREPPSTGIPGLFFAGDVARGKHRQAAIAAGDGVVAAMMIEQSFKEGDGHA